MNDKDIKVEQDPQLRKKGMPNPRSGQPAENPWEEAMKDVPSFSEHKKQIDEQKAHQDNAIKCACNKGATEQSKENAIKAATNSQNNRMSACARCKQAQKER